MKTYQIATDLDCLIYVIANNMVDAYKKFREKFLVQVSNDQFEYPQSSMTKVRNIHSVTESIYDISQDNLKDGVNFNMTLYMITYESGSHTNQDLDINLIALSDSQSLEEILKTNITRVEEYTPGCIIIN